MAGSRVKSNKFFKYLTIGAASLGVIASATFAVTMGIDATNDNFIVEQVREYTATFSSEGSVIMEQTYKRGELLDIPANPEHSMDGDGMYFFLGWDLTGNGFPDLVPSRAYYSFNAEAVYFRLGAFDLSFLDLENMDLESLLDLLNDLNIDWEQFMDMFDIDPETLMDWLMQNKVLSFEADESAYISYFRSTSFGDYNFQNSQFSAPAFYDSTLIRSGSINPLSYTADKLKNAYNLVGTLPANFDFVNYDITFNAKQDYYPVPDCEYSGETDADLIDSDAHYLKEPVDMKYQTHAAYVPAMNDVIDILKLVPFSNQAITKDERDYYKYALEHYTSIPVEYESLIDAIIEKNKWVEEDYSQVNNIGAYVESLGACSMFKDGEINLNYDKNKDPVRGLIENKQGTDLDFNTTAMMIARRLNIPARMVKGYVVPSIEKGTNDITMLNQHYWCEIYVKNIGWMIFDCMNAEDFLGTNPYGELDKESNPFQDQHELLEIKVTKKPTKLDYYVGETIDPAGAQVTAYYGDDTSKVLNLYTGSVTVSPMIFMSEGVTTVTVSYTEDGITKTDSFEVTVTKKPAQLTGVTWDYSVTKKEYFLDETLDKSGIIAIAHYDDGTEQDVSALVKTLGGTNLSMVGTQTITTYVEIDGETFKSNYEIEVIMDTVVSVVINNNPDKTTYYTGEEFTPSGMNVTVTYKSGQTHTYSGSELVTGKLEYLNTTFDTANEHQMIIVRFTNDDSTIVEDTFEVKVIQNVVASTEIYGFEQTYEIGDSFVESEFTNEQNKYDEEKRTYIEFTMVNGDKVKKYVDDFTNVTVPDLGHAGTTSSQVSVELDGVPIDVEVPITVTNVDPDKFSLSTKVSTAGPGSVMDGGGFAFSYTTSQDGTYYFRNASYDTYTPGQGWSWDTTPSAKTVSASSFAYEKLSQLYQTTEITVDYLKDVEYGVSPMYSEVGSYDEYLTPSSKTAGSSETFTATDFVLTRQTAKRLANYVEYSSATQTAYNSYRTTANFQKYLNDTSDNASYNAVNNYINNHPSYYSYNINDINDYVNLVLAVQNDISTEFTYNIDFVYPSDQDPIQSFFETGEGICNNFATVATMVYRHLGIPARYAVGFGTGTDGGTVKVSSANAHAWTEVFIDNVGWIIVDATGQDDGHRDYTGYGGGFGSHGFDRPKIAYGGPVTINYNYNQNYFSYDTSNGWYTVFDDRDHYQTNYSLSYESGKSLPNYLEAKIVWNWEYNGTNLGELSTPKHDAGYYVLTPTLHIYDKSLDNEDVTAEYDYYLAPGTENMEFTIFPCCIYLETYFAGSSNYSFSTSAIDYGGGTYILILNPSTDVKVRYNQSEIEDNPLLEMTDPLPTGKAIIFEVVGSYYIYEQGSFDLSFEVITEFDIYPTSTLAVVIRYADGSYLNLDNFIIINIGGSVEVTP